MSFYFHKKPSPSRLACFIFSFSSSRVVSRAGLHSKVPRAVFALFCSSLALVPVIPLQRKEWRPRFQDVGIATYITDTNLLVPGKLIGCRRAEGGCPVLEDKEGNVNARDP